MADLRDVYIIGVGQHPCGKFPTKAADVLGREAAWAAIKDAGIYARDIQMGFCGHVYQGMGYCCSRKRFRRGRPVPAGI